LSTHVTEIIGQGPLQRYFKEQELLKKAGLRQPTTLEIYHEIERRGLAYGRNSPKTIPELVSTLKPLDLMWVDVPPRVREGDSLNIGVMYGEYATQSPYEAINATVLHIHPGGRAIVELKRKGIKAGGVLLYDTDSYSLEEVNQILKEGEFVFVGAMGKKSKTLAEQDGIHLDVTSGVIDKSILMALCGKRCLILTAGGMVDHAMKRIKDYVDKSGIEFTVGVVNRENGCQWIEDADKNPEALKI
jgi:cobalt/nickel transport system ATP-binding protein